MWRNHPRAFGKLFSRCIQVYIKISFKIADITKENDLTVLFEDDSTTKILMNVHACSSCLIVQNLSTKSLFQVIVFVGLKTKKMRSQTRWLFRDIFEIVCLILILAISSALVGKSP